MSHLKGDSSVKSWHPVRSSGPRARKMSLRSGRSCGGHSTRRLLIWSNSVWPLVPLLLFLWRSPANRTAASISSARQQFDSKTRILRWILTSGLRILIQFWYTREAVFWIPGGWVPGYVEWGLSFPKAPIGSVSIQVWSFAVGQVVTLLSGLVAYVFALFAARFMAPRLVSVLEEEEEEVKSI